MPSLLRSAAAGVAALVAATLVSCSSESAPTGTLEERNTALVSRVLDEIDGQGLTDRLGDFYAPHYVEHDPAIGGGRDGLTAWVTQAQAQQPRSTMTVKRIIAQGSMVAVHSQRSASPADEMTGTAVVELFDLRGGRIVEHWSYSQAVSPTTRSGNSMFSNVYQYATNPPNVSALQVDSNKQLVLKAWAAVYSARDFTVLDRYWAPNDGYLQHNPKVPNGVGGLRGFLSSQPASVSQNRFALASGDLVLTVNQSIPTDGDLANDRAGSSVVDIYRVVDGRFVEHWDVIANVPANSANGNSVFSRLYPAAA